MRSQPEFSLLADDTRDINNHEPLVVRLSWVADNYEVLEDFISLI